MLNQVILVGRLVRAPEIQETESGKSRSYITLAVSRGYKNPNGEYETDFLDCTLWSGIAENTAEYCKSGDIIGVKGKLQTYLIENEDGSKRKRTEIVADKVTFLSSHKSENDEKSVEIESNNDDDSGENLVKESEKKYKKSKK